MRVYLDGVDISAEIRKYLLDMDFTDFEEDQTDDIQIKLQDREGIWLLDWLGIAFGEMNTITGTPISVDILRMNWGGFGDQVLMECGTFELDSVSASGPPCTVTMKGTALPFSAPVRLEKKNKAWEHCSQKKIAEEIAQKNGLGLTFDSDSNPTYDRVEQIDMTDIIFLQRLCQQSGNALKATAEKLIIFDQAKYEEKGTIATIFPGCGYTKYSFQTNEADTKFTSCHVQYTNPDTGKTIEATFVDPGEESKSKKIAASSSDDKEAPKQDKKVKPKKPQKDTVRLEVRTKVKDEAEALQLAKKMLRLKNKYQGTLSFTFPGTPFYLAGVNVEVERFGAFNGKYMISESKHTVDGSGGYETVISLRPVMEGL